MQKKKRDIRIVILQRGWVFVGDYHQQGEKCSLTHAHNVRKWGTSRGLGEIASGGPTVNTILDPCPDVRFHEQTTIATIDCVEAKWQDKI